MNFQIDWDTLSVKVIEYAGNICLALLVLFVGFKLAKFTANLIEKALEKKGLDESVRPFISALASALLKAAVVISALGVLGVETTAFAAVLAAMGLAIGMALSGNLQNFAGGVLILIFRPIKVGEFIEAQGESGKVHEILIFQTILLTADNKTVVIPNGILSNGTIVNYSRQPTRRVDLSFGIGYDDDVELAKSTILEVISRHEKVISDPAEPFVRVSALADSSINFAVRVWAQKEDYWDIHFFLLEEVKRAFDEKGISIPFPQTDVHLHRPSE